MKRHVASSLLVACTTIAFACNGEFRFDDAADGATTPDASNGTDTATPPRRCTADDACSAVGLRCETASGRCVECMTESDCAGKAFSHCDVRMHVCVACRSQADCGERERCDTDDTRNCLGTCAEGDERCTTAGFSCDDDRRLCIECKTNANCAGSTTGKVCDAPHGKCVECVGNAQCPEARPRCDRRQGRCVGCLIANDCPEGQACRADTLVCADVR